MTRAGPRLGFHAVLRELRRDVWAHWLAGRAGGGRTVGPLQAAERQPGGWRIATRDGDLWICGSALVRQWRSQPQAQRSRQLERLFGPTTRAILLARAPVHREWRALARRRTLPLLALPADPDHVARRLTGALPEAPDGEQALVPGTLVVVHGRGILLTGPSGCGKSDLALALLDRGHRLLSDDAVFLCRTGERLTALADPAWLGALGVRGLGILDVRRLWDAATCSEHVLHGIVALSSPSVSQWEVAVTNPGWDMVRLQGVAIPRLRLPTAPDRPLPLLVETVARGLANGRGTWFGLDRGLPWN